MKMKRKSLGNWSEVLKMFWTFNLHEKYSLENKSTNNMNDNIFFFLQNIVWWKYCT